MVATGRGVKRMQQQPVPTLGHVTSSYWSPNLGRSFALALVKGGRSRIGTALHVPLEDSIAAARIVAPVFWDQQGLRLNA
jgi:sarcosine oxidase, subunit alpha